MPWTGSYEALRHYLRHFTNIGGDPVPYDHNGVVHLMLALLDNLRENALDVDLADIRESMTDDQAAFFLRLADHVREGDRPA
jgi:hypothetical protein